MEDVLIVGASVRAAAFSALRAGLRPRGIDLFADRDLAAVCPARAIPAERYPDALLEMAREEPASPWLYTGALENRPDLIERISRDRPLWGNDAACLDRVRDPFELADAVNRAGLPCPAVRRPGDRLPVRRLVKPLASGGGAGIHFQRSGSLRHPSRHYLQEFIEGDSCAGLFVAGPDGCQLLGVTRQLIGEKWLHATGFRYAGSIGPLPLRATEQAAWERLGTTAAEFAGLRGLFGIDAIVRDGVPWPVEVNPRYTASVEVVEYATGRAALALHCGAFAGESVRAGSVSDGQAGPSLTLPARKCPTVGKAIWFAPRRIEFPADGPWEATLRQPPRFDQPPEFADIPAAGQSIAAGRPVITVFASGAIGSDCEQNLRSAAVELDARLLR